MASPGLLLPIVLGAVVMLFSLVRLRSVLALLDDEHYRQYWLTMGFLMTVFLVGFLAAGGAILTGSDWVFKVMGASMFLLGALFAFLVVHTGYLTIEELVRSHEAVEEREEELEWLYEVTDVLNRILRHNVRNNMNVIIGLTDLVHEDVSDATKEHVEAIQDEAQKLVQIGDKAQEIHQTIDSEIETETVEAETLVEVIVGELRRTFPEAEIDTSGVDDEQLRAGPLLETAVENVLDNAVRHNDADVPEVTVSTTREGGEVVLVVADNGPGIHPDELEVIRESKETPLQHGSGLGLWLVNWIVEQYDGTLTFEDNDPEGTVVRLSLPAEQRPPTSAVEGPDGVEA